MAATPHHMRQSKTEEELRVGAFEESITTNKIERMVASISCGHSGTEKFSHYDSGKLLSYGAFATLFSTGTIFVADKQLYFVMSQYIIVALICMALYIALGVQSDEDGNVPATEPGGFLHTLKLVSDDLNSTTPFVFGFFVSVTLARWWSMRSDTMCTIMSAIKMNVLYLQSQLQLRNKGLSQEVVKDLEEDIRKLIRYGVSSMWTMTAHARGRLDLSKLVSQGLLTEEERVILEDVPNREQVLWTWIGSVGVDVMETLKVPPPNMNPYLMEVKKAANAITALEAYYDSQLPFPYVHMIVLLLAANNLMMSVVTALQMAVDQHLNKNTAFVTGCLNLFVVQMVYQALCFVCFLIEDPFGDDVTDFPIIAFQGDTYATCKHLVTDSRKFWEYRVKAGCT